MSLLSVAAIPILLIAGSVLYDGWRISRGDYPLADRTEAKVGALSITLERYVIHPYLAEYRRVLTVVMADGSKRVSELSTDTGGASRIDVCELGDGDLRLSDRFGHYRLNLAGNIMPVKTVSVSQAGPGGLVISAGVSGEAPQCVRNLGRFDTDAERGYMFQPTAI
ncbi:hypothetical protein [Neorhizobium sp. JUb45]|uniref:hypothetical protein n=1 Tax=unclassified Neorhizobium TaxID=2629175 RepID=UPI0010488371|nr:hypothetical protein [Neorhizobium sp. JUb45]